MISINSSVSWEKSSIATRNIVGLVVTTTVIISYASGHVMRYHEISNATLGNGVETIFSVIVVTLSVLYAYIS